MENTNTDKTAQQPLTDDVKTGLDEDEYDGFIGVTGVLSDMGQCDMVSEGVEEDTDDEEEEEGLAAQPKDKYEDCFPRMPSVWATTNYISKWKMAHRRGYHVNCLTNDHQRKAAITQQELDCKTSVSLPMVCVMEKEALQILQNIEKDYKCKLGTSHHMTKELHERIESLKSQLSSKTEESPPETPPESPPGEGLLGTLFQWGRALSTMLGWGKASAATEEENDLTS